MYLLQHPVLLRPPHHPLPPPERKDLLYYYPALCSVLFDIIIHMNHRRVAQQKQNLFPYLCSALQLWPRTCCWLSSVPTLPSHTMDIYVHLNSPGDESFQHGLVLCKYNLSQAGRGRVAVIKHDGLIVDILIGNYMGPLANVNHPLHTIFTLA